MGGDASWMEGIHKKIDDFFNNATEEELNALLQKANFDYYNDPENFGVSFGLLALNLAADKGV